MKSENHSRFLDMVKTAGPTGEDTIKQRVFSPTNPHDLNNLSNLNLIPYCFPGG